MKKKINVKLGGDKETRGIIFQGIIICIFLLLLTRLFYLQVMNGEEYSARSNNNRVKLKRIEAPRGKIFDSEGELLVTNEAGYRLLYLNERSYDEEIVKEIAELLGYTEASIEKKIKNGEIFSYTRENILIEDLDEIEAHKIIEKLGDYPYLEIQAYAKRKYLDDESSSHVLGYVKKISATEYDELKDLGYTKRDIVGKNGVEKTYDFDLQGEAGYEYIEVNALNRIVKKLNEKEAIPGKDMYLTIDSKLQKHVEAYFEENELQGSFVAMDPKTGEILTLVSYPNYSLNMFASRFTSEEWNTVMNDKRKPLINRPLAGEYPPGSIYKPIVSMALLENGLDPNEKFFDNGYYQIGKWKWKAWKSGGHGYVDLEKALIESANPYFYKNGDALGHTKIAEMSMNLGLGEKTGIDIPGEKSARVPTNEWKKSAMGESWYRGDTVNLSIGQGYLTVTPLQMAEAYSVLANKGYAYKPHVVKYLTGKEDTKIIPQEKVIDLDYSEEYYEVITEALIKAVSANNGTAKALRTEGLDVAAKTGSAQNSQSKISHAWSAGYFPARDPEIVFVAFAESAGGGGSMAAPIAKSFIDRYLAGDEEVEVEELEVKED